MDYIVVAQRVDASGSLARAKQAEVILGTDLAGREDAFNPVELLLAALAACMIKGVERVKPLLAFTVEGVEVRLQAFRQDAPPKIVRIAYEIIVDSAETQARLDLLHRNVLKYGTISNTLVGALELVGSLRRA
jgi:uncharacterized OsmC-like protein